MKLRNRSFSCNLLPYIIVVIAFLPITIADLISEKEALLNFANAVPHGAKLNWNSNTPICSWTGITCDANRSHVLELRLPAVSLSGPIPANTLGKLDALRVLSLRSNLLSGNLPSDISSLKSLQYLFLQSNNFSGSIPTSLPSNLTFLDLSFNSFKSEIPLTIRNLTLLTTLNLQSNSLYGHIPDLNLRRLKHLNVSNNNLNGSIPASLQRFPNSSFLGNSLLCGLPLVQCPSLTPPPSLTPLSPPQPPSPQPPAKKSPKRKLSTVLIIAIAVGGSALVFVLALIASLCCLRKKDTQGDGVSQGKDSKRPQESSGAQEPEKNKLTFFEGCSYTFDLEDLLRASAEILGKGNSGMTYKAILEEGNSLVVKRLKDVVVAKKEFGQQMEIVGRIGQHPNLVPLRAYYYSKDEKLLVYDYMSAGNFSTLLHGNKGSERTPLDWESRIKISLAAARGIAHIHREGGGRFIHGNIKSTNILLNSDLEGCVSDFGLAPIVSIPVGPSRAVGYRAPEAIQTRKVTQKSDVYSFGVLLLETLTGKVPAQSPGCSDSIADLPRWVQSIVREEWTAEVFDAELLRSQNIEEEMIQMLQIALACVAKEPDQRPTMEDIVRMIDDIRQLDSLNWVSPKDSNVQ